MSFQVLLYMIFAVLWFLSGWWIFCLEIERGAFRVPKNASWYRIVITGAFLVALLPLIQVMTFIIFADDPEARDRVVWRLR